MRKSRAVAACIVVAAALGVHTAAAAASCAAGHYYYAGYEKNNIVANGQLASADITFNSGSYGGSQSFVGGWVGVNNDTITRWLQAGLDYEAAFGKAAYIEYQNDAGYSFTQHGYFIIGNAYHAHVKKVSAGHWDAVIGMHAEDNISISGMTMTQFEGESYTGTSTCNSMNYTFASSSPWGTADFDFLDHDSPYLVSNITANGWKSSG